MPQNYLSSKWLEHALDVATHLVLESGEYAKTRFGKARATHKVQSLRGIQGAKPEVALSVGSVDYGIQHLILGGLVDADFNKDIGLITEEETRDREHFVDNPNLRWVLDPLDGSLNYHSENPDYHPSKGSELTSPNHTFFGISLGLQQNQNDFLFAIVYLPLVNEGELYVAVKNQGARKNGKRLHFDEHAVRNVRQLGRHEMQGDTLLVTVPSDFANKHRIGLNSKSDFARPLFPRHMQPYCTVYALTGVADGKLQAYFARETFLHDFGPSLLVVREAGGFVSDENERILDCRRATEQGKMPFVIAGPNQAYNHALINYVRQHHPAVFDR